VFEAEHAAVTFDGIDDILALLDRVSHGLLTPDVTPGFGRGNGNQGVPMGRSGDMKDIDIPPVEDITEILVAFAPRACLLESGGQVMLIDVTDGEKPRLRIVEDIVDMARTHSPDPNNSMRQRLAGRRLTAPGNGLARYDGDSGEGRHRLEGLIQKKLGE